MELIKNFGVDPTLLGAQILNFLIIFFVLKRFLYKPLLKQLDDRKKAIKEGVENAEKARVLLEKTEEKERSVLKKAQEQAKTMLDEAKKQQAILVAETEEKTRIQAETILAEARNQIAFESKEAEKKLATKVTELAVFLLQKSLTGTFSEKDQDAIVKDAIKKLKQEKN